MPSLKIMTFNVENMLARFGFREYEKKRLATLLDIDSDVDRANLIRTHFNVLNAETRVCTALSIADQDPDVVCVQEVESMRALSAFHDRYLKRISRRQYSHQFLIDGNDPRGIDVAVLSRYRIASATTHQDLEKVIAYPDPQQPTQQRVFRRDCLEVNIKKNNRTLPIFICHFKSMTGGRDETRVVREAEAAAVREIIEDRFAEPAASEWLVVGDLNDYTEVDGQADDAHGLGPLLNDNFAVDLIKRIGDPRDRWTHYYGTEDSYRQLDYMLASPALAAANGGVVPIITRKGQPCRASRYARDQERWPRIGWDNPKASDHCPVSVTLNFGEN
jgi:endonuclease/exonuclease/phosphatase family metal-dependent hydrolase